MDELSGCRAEINLKIDRDRYKLITTMLQLFRHHLRMLGYYISAFIWGDSSLIVIAGAETYERRSLLSPRTLPSSLLS